MSDMSFGVVTVSFVSSEEGWDLVQYVVNR